MSEASTPNPAPQHSPAPAPKSPGNSQVKNIIIGAVATVFASTAVYYLTQYQNKKSDSSPNYLVVKEATTSAWKSYVAYDNVYTKNSLTFEKNAAETGPDEYLEGVKSEAKKFEADVTDLLQTKDIDKDLVKALKRRLDNEKVSITKTEEYFNTLKKIAAGTAPDKDKREAVVKEMARWNTYYKSAFERNVNDIQDIAKTLSERYGQQFTMNDFLIVQIAGERMKSNDSLVNALRDANEKNKAPVDPKSITGHWSDGEDHVSLMADGKMSYSLSNGEKATGTWKIENNKLLVDAVNTTTKEKKTWHFSVSDIKPGYFVMTMLDEPYDVFELVRTKGK